MADAMKSTTTAMVRTPRILRNYVNPTGWNELIVHLSFTQKQVKMNKAVDAPAINKMMKEFEKENMKSEMMQEVMGEMMDDAMEQDGDVEESDKIVSQVLDEIGITFGTEIPDAPMIGTGTQVAPEKAKVAAAADGGGGDDSQLSDLQQRLNDLNNN
jgi:charged multivesicular body protein 2A